jgi:hypothetical protein
MGTPRGIFASSKVSTKSGEVHNIGMNRNHVQTLLKKHGLTKRIHEAGDGAETLHRKARREDTPPRPTL